MTLTSTASASGTLAREAPRNPFLTSGSRQTIPSHSLSAQKISELKGFSSDKSATFPMMDLKKALLLVKLDGTCCSHGAGPSALWCQNTRPPGPLREIHPSGACSGGGSEGGSKRWIKVAGSDMDASSTGMRKAPCSMENVNYIILYHIIIYI